MEQNTLDNHYRNLAQNYDTSFSTDTLSNKSQGKYNFLGEEGAKVIVDLLDIKEDDRLVDLGAGTCKTAGMVAQLAGLKYPVLCVDPVQEMLEIGKEIHNIETLCATADEFVKKDIKYDKVIIKGAVHHFPINKMREIFEGIKKQLNDNGAILIDQSRGNNKIGMPFFKKGIDTQNQLNAGVVQLVENVLKDLGFKVDLKLNDVDMKTSKENAIKIIKNRSVSGLSTLSDEEIKEGIEEVDKAYKDGAFIDWTNSRILMLAKKN